MDFSAWSPSHLIVAALVLATIIGQAIAVLARLKANTEQLQKQGETFVNAMERLEDSDRQEIRGSESTTYGYASGDP